MRIVPRLSTISRELTSSPRRALHASRTVVTMLPSSPHVRNVYVEEDGIISALRALPPEIAQSTLCIDSTTLDVEVARDVAAEVERAGAAIVDAPVSGGVTGARAATLSFLVGGPEKAFKVAYPHLLNMGKNVIYCGDSGAGLVAKICNNLILGVQQIVVAEGMLLGQRLGLDPKVLASVINSSTGACWASSVNNPAPSALPDKSPPCERDYEGGFATSLMLKVCFTAPVLSQHSSRTTQDMGLATDLAESTGIPLPLGNAAEKIYADVVSEDPELANKDFSSVYRYLRVSKHL